MFGNTVDIFEDHAVVGSVDNDNNFKTNNGAAYVFSKNKEGPTNWGQIQELIPTDTENYMYFGKCVGINQELIMVGVDHSDSNYDTGGVYVYSNQMPKRVQFTSSNNNINGFIGNTSIQNKTNIIMDRKYALKGHYVKFTALGNQWNIDGNIDNIVSS